MINVVFANPLFLGGQTTFTVHLLKSLRAVGASASLVKVAKRTERRCRDFGYGEQYRNTSVEDICRLDGVNLIVATCPQLITETDRLITTGARVVIHDPTHLKQGWNWRAVSKPVVIRTSMLKVLRNAVFLRHPYIPSYTSQTNSVRKFAAISVCRITSNKHIDILLEANRSLPKAHQIYVRGAQHRPYVNFWLKPRYPEWTVEDREFPREFGYAVNSLCAQAVFTCDMSTLAMDGGGTQYSFLEAMDACSCLIVNTAWLGVKGCMQDGVNCLAVGGASELVSLIRRYRLLKDQQLVELVEKVKEAGYRLLRQHDGRVVVKEWINELLRNK